MSVFQKILAIVLMTCACAFANADELKTIKLGAMGWEDQSSLVFVGKRVLEREGYKVEITNFSEWGIAYAALARGDIDLMVSQINYVAFDYWKKNKNRLEKVSVASHGLRQGIVVPSYMNIDSIDQLNGIKDQVGGKIVGIEPGSGLMRELKEAVKQYPLDYTVIDSSTAAMAAELEGAIQRKAPIVTVLWKPSWQVYKYDVKFLDDPKHIFAPPQSYYWIAKKGFSLKNPHAREALASMFVSIDDVTHMNAEMNEGISADEAAERWWKANADVTQRWSELSKPD
ncbi:glycine betaine ABC transporter substrate-binding protein [Pseudomonas sp. CC120222-01a]|uniref:glycine betaine ABC transporter substrate-binding protein n=1 Tax=Pseudomonas sp. CC120222-01a TaxID=1378075 RepID=UPI000D99092A|nr:glycine betaine ABC transporter substrate-binding protein [Pseudomonas sp. CC120222-01a]PVZ41213.1 glycine betaine/proline transport system substrate-binding protein [Pseudomonas sp. CC120222-01a]